MADDSAKWIKGCGIGCGLLLIIIVIVVLSGFFFVKSKIENFKNAEYSLELLTERYGNIVTYCPTPDGSIAADRIELFLTIRDSTKQLRNTLENSLVQFTEKLKQSQGNSTFNKIIKLFREGEQAFDDLMYYYTTRNDLIANMEMSLGEYYYIYVLSYYCWLEKSPGDGPEFKFPNDEKGENTVDIKDENFWFGDNVKETRLQANSKKINQNFLTILKCQLNTLEEQQTNLVDSNWRKRLKEEIDALETNEYHLPWMNGLPQQIENSFKPFKERLLESYSELINPVEINPIKD